MTSGRRVRKRNLEECNGNTSGSKRTKKSKRSSKSLRRKSSKAKTLRPQRIAAHNARNMFPQFGETSTDEEDNDSEDESSESLQDSDNLSEPERKIHSKREELKKPLLEESADVSKPPSYSESRANVENRPRLVLKFSLRDTKKNAPLVETRFAGENQADVVCQSARHQPQESVQKTSPDTSFMTPASSFIDPSNAMLPESHKKNENDEKTKAEVATSNLDTSICLEGSTEQCRQIIRRHAYEHSGSRDAPLVDTEINGHLEFNTNGYVKPETNFKVYL